MERSRPVLSHERHQSCLSDNSGQRIGVRVNTRAVVCHHSSQTRGRARVVTELLVDGQDLDLNLSEVSHYLPVRPCILPTVTATDHRTASLDTAASL